MQRQCRLNGSQDLRGLFRAGRRAVATIARCFCSRFGTRMDGRTTSICTRWNHTWYGTGRTSRCCHTTPTCRRMGHTCWRRGYIDCCTCCCMGRTYRSSRSTLRWPASCIRSCCPRTGCTWSSMSAGYRDYTLCRPYCRHWCAHLLDLFTIAALGTTQLAESSNRSSNDSTPDTGLHDQREC